VTRSILQPDYLFLVVDFEATCCDQGTIPSEEMEIIEIGACWALADGAVIDQFGCLVKPTLHPVLTPFCHNLLGIRQEDIEGAETITNAALMLSTFVAQRSAHAVAWGSWGAFDSRQLDRECLRVGIPNPIELPHQNLKQLFAKRQRIGKQVGMRKALELAKLDLLGIHHRALDDALNISRLLPWAIGGMELPARQM
jgi:inhibitor of KinA sporulation pathway (predicted exonuclease)